MELHQEGSSNGSTYQITSPNLIDMWQAMRRKEESMKFDEPRQRMHGYMDLVDKSDDLEQALQKNEVSWVEDESN